MPGDGDSAALVETVRSFVNTYEVHEDEDRIASPDALLRWLTGQGLLDDDIDAPTTVSRTELALTHELRSTLRELLHRRHGADAGTGATTELGPGSEARVRVERLSGQLPLRVVLYPDGQPHLVPAVGGVRYALARILAAVAALPSNEWERLKVCPADDCQWVFYDESRNRSRRWCSMEGCGNRSKVRSYRQRTR
jgi:predicted RNA-binding Zn ribbon-like protein